MLVESRLFTKLGMHAARNPRELLAFPIVVFVLLGQCHNRATAAPMLLIAT